MGMKLRIGEREAALGYKGGFRFETTAEEIGVRETDARPGKRTGVPAFCAKRRNS